MDGSLPRSNQHRRILETQETQGCGGFLILTDGYDSNFSAFHQPGRLIGDILPAEGD